jgi:hypothetical protein
MKLVKYKQLIVFLENTVERGGFIRESKVRKLTPQHLKLIQEICVNIIRSNIVLPKTVISKLKEHKALLKKLSADKLSLNIRKKILSTHEGGDFLAILLPSVFYFLRGKNA